MSTASDRGRGRGRGGRGTGRGRGAALAAEDDNYTADLEEATGAEEKLADDAPAARAAGASPSPAMAALQSAIKPVLVSQTKFNKLAAALKPLLDTIHAKVSGIEVSVDQLLQHFETDVGEEPAAGGGAGGGEDDAPKQPSSAASRDVVDRARRRAETLIEAPSRPSDSKGLHLATYSATKRIVHYSRLLLDAGDLPSLRKNLSTLEDFFQVLEYAMEKLGAEPRHGMSTATEIGLRALPKSYEATKEAPFDWSRFAADEVKAKRDEWSSAAARERERSRSDRYKDDRYSSYKRDNYKDSGKDKK